MKKNMKKLLFSVEGMRNVYWDESPCTIGCEVSFPYKFDGDQSLCIISHGSGGLGNDTEHFVGALNDSGIASHYGSHNGVLELTADGATAIYGDQRIPLPTMDDERVDYLRAVIAVDSNNGQLKERLAKMLAPPPPVIETEASAAENDSGPAEQGAVQNTETNVSPGNCQ